MAEKNGIGPDRQDVLRAAHSMIMNHGSRAAAVAAFRARNLGDDACDARIMWERICQTIDQLTRPAAARAA